MGIVLSVVRCHTRVPYQRLAVGFNRWLIRVLTHNGADTFALQNPANGAILIDVHDDYGELVVLAQGEGITVHHLQSSHHCLLVRDFGYELGIGMQLWIGRIYAVHIGRLYQQIGFDL